MNHIARILGLLRLYRMPPGRVCTAGRILTAIVANCCVLTAFVACASTTTGAPQTGLTVMPDQYPEVIVGDREHRCTPGRLRTRQ